MKVIRYAVLGAMACTAFCLVRASGQHSTHAKDSRVVRIAELEIDPAQLASYKAALKEEIETSIRVEPGVLMLSAIAVAGHPGQVRIFEIYRDQDSYQSHLQTDHFKKYKALTAEMVRSLNLIETEPIVLASKAR